MHPWARNILTMYTVSSLGRGFARYYGTHAIFGIYSRLSAASMSAHSSAQQDSIMKTSACCDVYTVPVLSDNYSYLIADKLTRKTACVDPAEPLKVLASAKENNLEISVLLCTHKHADHSGGNLEMSRKLPGLNVIAPAFEDDVPAVTTRLHDNEIFELGNLVIKCLHTPCHTRGHSVYFVYAKDSDLHGTPVLFSGDTLFVGGCGRFFEGDAKDMLKSLGPGGVIWDLPMDTLVYCGHEYTVSNLQFAASIEPDNAVLQAKLEWAKSMIALGKHTIPSTLGEEMAYNPFMRAHLPSIMQSVGATTPEECMAKLRELKNNFRPPPIDASRYPRL